MTDDRINQKIKRKVDFRIPRSGAEYDAENVAWIWAVTRTPRNLPDGGFSGILWDSERYMIVYTTVKDLNGWWPEPNTIVSYMENPDYQPFDPRNPSARYQKAQAAQAGKRGPDRVPRGPNRMPRDTRTMDERILAFRAARAAGCTGRIEIMEHTGVSSAMYYRLLKLVDTETA